MCESGIVMDFVITFALTYCMILDFQAKKKITTGRKTDGIVIEEKTDLLIPPVVVIGSVNTVDGIENEAAIGTVAGAGVGTETTIGVMMIIAGTAMMIEVDEIAKEKTEIVGTDIETERDTGVADMTIDLTHKNTKQCMNNSARILKGLL